MSKKAVRQQSACKAKNNSVAVDGNYNFVINISGGLSGKHGRELLIMVEKAISFSSKDTKSSADTAKGSESHVVDILTFFKGQVMAEKATRRKENRCDDNEGVEKEVVERFFASLGKEGDEQIFSLQKADVGADSCVETDAKDVDSKIATQFVAQCIKYLDKGLQRFDLAESTKEMLKKHEKTIGKMLRGIDNDTEQAFKRVMIEAYDTQDKYAKVDVEGSNCLWGQRTLMIEGDEVVIASDISATCPDSVKVVRIKAASLTVACEKPFERFANVEKFVVDVACLSELYTGLLKELFPEKSGLVIIGLSEDQKSAISTQNDRRVFVSEREEV